MTCFTDVTFARRYYFVFVRTLLSADMGEVHLVLGKP
jgi:hypothetical protein